MHPASRTACLAGAFVLAALSFWLGAAAAQPRLPCNGVAPSPSHSQPGEAPRVQTWKATPWQPPGCLPWPSAQYRLLVALAGRARNADVASLLSRFAAVSGLRGLRYWSVSDKAWRVLVEDAWALSAPDASRRRSDFRLEELLSGASVYFAQRDNRSSEAVVYRMRVLEASDDRLAIETENASPVRAFLATVFPPGSLRGAWFVEREAPDLWRIYALSAVSDEASTLTAVSEDSYINRAGAFYRHVLGLAGDAGPPLAP